MRDEDTAIRGALHRTEDTGTSGCAAETDIEVALEGAGAILIISFGVGDGAIGLADTLVLIGQAEFGEGAARAKETSSIG